MHTIRTTNGFWTGALLALALVLIPVDARAQDDPRLDRIRAELPEVAVERIEARLDQARAQGLPVEPLLDKAVEGIAKQVPGARIAGAVDQLAQELGRAQSVLGEGVPSAPADVTAVADAMRRGVPDEAIQQLAQGANPDEPLALAVHTLGDLMDRGVPVEQALGVLNAWRERGGQADELRELPDAIDRLMRQGVLPAQAATAVANAMRGGPAGQGHGQGQGPPGQAPGSIGETGPPIPPGSGPPDDRGNPPDDTPPGGNNGNGPPGG